MKIPDIIEFLETVSVQCHSDEIGLQGELAIKFRDEGIKFHREYPLSSSDRIDFLISDGIGIEIKLETSVTKMIRQLHRYAAHDEISELVLVTTDPKLMRIPSVLNGKPVKVVLLSSTIF